MEHQKGTSLGCKACEEERRIRKVSVSKHTPRNLHYKEEHYANADSNFKILINEEVIGKTNTKVNAEFIVRACNSHDELLEALKSCIGLTGFISTKENFEKAIKAIAKAEGGN